MITGQASGTLEVAHFYSVVKNRQELIIKIEGEWSQVTGIIRCVCMYHIQSAWSNLSLQVSLHILVIIGGCVYIRFLKFNFLKFPAGEFRYIYELVSL